MTLAASHDISLRIRNVIVVSFSRGSSAEQDFQQWPEQLVPTRLTFTDLVRCHMALAHSTVIPGMIYDRLCARNSRETVLNR